MSKIHKVSISNGRLSADILSLGGIIQQLNWHGQAGVQALVLSYHKPQGYLEDPYFIGTLVGRFANRIRSPLVIDGVEYPLSCNEGNNCLHGGTDGLHKQIFEVVEQTAHSVLLSCRLADGHMGFPGNLEIQVRYTITKDERLITEISATTDKTTPVSITQHSYFCLGTDQQAQLFGERVLCNDEKGIPNGKSLPLAKPWPEDNHVVGDESGELWKMAQISSQANALQLEIWSDQPGYQFYQTEHLGAPFAPRQGLCVEPQQVPNAPNQNQSGLLAAGERYSHTIEYRVQTLA
ncbi:aldose epimerase family protein [Paraferrimonas sedimenticola]|uniref:Aldose 1-epimerase n=1 Tax=Paraferrimonas sedimenticola TaxID=375674 RepID=A0AA37VUU5_9GAMM|nr:aldose epimerase family protein [Paraferrimonas sedimenticola]GLP95906.1 aldose 1-epimerase [Paraferrimonas sedimenticola]